MSVTKQYPLMRLLTLLVFRLKFVCVVSQGFSNGSVVKSPPAMQEMRVQCLVWEELPEKEMATHFSIVAWKIPWTERPGRIQSMGSQKSQTQLNNNSKFYKCLIREN